MKSILNSLFLFASFLTLTSLANAEQKVYELDKSHTYVGYEISHLGFSTSRGHFSEVEGAFTVDPDNLENSVVGFTIQTNSLNSFWAQRDEHLKGKDYLDVEAYPEMTFKSAKIVKTADNTYTVSGDLTIKGVTKPTDFNITLINKGINPFNKKEVLGFSGEAQIKRTDFGITEGVPAVGDDVKIVIDLEIRA